VLLVLIEKLTLLSMGEFDIILPKDMSDMPVKDSHIAE
jgi:hypothetical protein